MKVQVSKSKRPEYKWVIAFVCGLALFFGLGFCSSAKNIYIAPITAAFGFSRSAFTVSDSVRYITTAGVTVFLDKLVRKFGTKKLFAAGLFSYILFALISAYAKSLFGFYLGGVFLGFGVAWSSTTVISVVINKWFVKNKGTVLGTVLALNGLGAAIAVFFFTPIVYVEGDAFGYRRAYLITAALISLIAVIFMILYKEKGDEKEESADGFENKMPENEALGGFEFCEITKMPAFYAVIVSLFLYTLTSVTTIATPHFTDIGFDASFVGFTLSLSSIALAVCKVITGVLYDRLGIRTATNICLASVLLSRLLLFAITASPVGKGLAVLYCVLISIATPIETVMLPLIALDLFGQRSFGKTLSVVSVLFTIGHAMNAPIINLPFDITGNYTLSFSISSASALVILVVMNASITNLKRKKKYKKQKGVEYV